ATFAVVNGIGQKNRIKADRIAEDILGDQGADIAINLLYAMDELSRDLSVIKQRRASFRNDDRFAEWIENRYLIPQFSGFTPRLNLYNPEGEKIVSRDISGFFGPETGIRLEDQATQVNEYLYQYPNRQNKYLDNYVGRFFLALGQDTTSQYQFLLDLRPNIQEATNLYPSLVLDQSSYENVRLLNAFDYAVYREGLLATEAGEYAFPIELDVPVDGQIERVRSDLGMVERYYSLTSTKTAVVRFPLQDPLNIITTFSFIFYFFLIGAVILILIPVWSVRYLRDRKINVSPTLRARIRFGLLSISLLPMLVIVIVLYPFIRTKYFEQAQNELAREAVRIAAAVGPEYADMVSDELATRYQWQKFEDRIRSLGPTLRNDINIFDVNGRRIATTQPLAFDGAFATDLMEAEAYQRLKNGGVSELIIEESIGTLTYISCYRPLIGASSRPMGYVNIPYLTQQDELDGQVLDFLAYLANIYLLVFLLINLIAVLVASTITKPLSVIRQRIAATRLGDKNEPIQYDSEDEIGEIVAAYNGMLDQLEESEKQLTQNQREEAWRQMARQVAHEIKNPLTPMKLSIQHLKRSWQENAPRFQGMFPKVMKTLLVQIDSMVHIANSFSEFARMPEPVNTRIKVNDVLLEVVDLYTQSQEAIWLIDIPKEPFWVFADRDQLSRSFNNIIKNALQAIETNGILHISMRVEDMTAFIEIKDNGKGIPEEIQQKVFEPSFSTKNSGMGLGLAIVRRIIEHANGRIRFESIEGVGTTFYIQLPAAMVEPEPARIGQ
ncbi:MAG: HAMP domain-containing sensor histidine kinase, partial [Bacteroidota bacterium]